MVNRVGPTFVHRLGEITGGTRRRSCAPTCASREVFGLVPLWQHWRRWTTSVPDAVQAEMVIALRGCRARHHLVPAFAPLFEPTEQQVEALRAGGAGPARAGRGGQRFGAGRGHWVQAGVPQALAGPGGSFGALFAALDIAEIAEAGKRPVALTAQVHAGGGERWGWSACASRSSSCPPQLLAEPGQAGPGRQTLVDCKASIGQQAVGPHEGRRMPRRCWTAGRKAIARRWSGAQRLLANCQEDPAAPNSAMLSVALRESAQPV
jgi:glutamate dehydrogenase